MNTGQAMQTKWLAGAGNRSQRPFSHQGWQQALEASLMCQLMSQKNAEGRGTFIYPRIV